MNYTNLRDISASFIEKDDEDEDDVDQNGSFDIDQSAASSGGMPSFNGSKMFAKRAEPIAVRSKAAKTSTSNERQPLKAVMTNKTSKAH